MQQLFYNLNKCSNDHQKRARGSTDSPEAACVRRQQTSGRITEAVCGLTVAMSGPIPLRCCLPVKRLWYSSFPSTHTETQVTFRDCPSLWILPLRQLVDKPVNGAICPRRWPNKVRPAVTSPTFIPLRSLLDSQHFNHSKINSSPSPVDVSTPCWLPHIWKVHSTTQPFTNNAKVWQMSFYCNIYTQG